MGYHKDLNGSDLHIAHSWTFINEADRLSVSGVVPTDIGKIGLQTDYNTFWVLTSVSPITWVSITMDEAHRNNTSNPHMVSKTDVGLGNVPNIDTTNATNITTGTLPSSVIPPIALVSVQLAANESAMLGLTTEEGDVVVRTDENKSYMRGSGTAGTMADFIELQSPEDIVLSVNGNTGTVVLTKADLGLSNVENRTITISASGPSGGSDGDIWLQY